MRAGTAWEIHRAIVEAKLQGAFLSLRLGALLAKMREGTLYKELDYATWESYLGSPEVSMSPRTADRFIRLHRLYVGKLGYGESELAEAGISKLDIVARMVEPEGQDPLPKAEADEWVARAKTLSKADLIAEVAEARGDPDPEPPRRVRVWAGWIEDDDHTYHMRAICFTRMEDERGAGAGLLVENPEFLGYAEVDLAKLDGREGGWVA